MRASVWLELWIYDTFTFTGLAVCGMRVTVYGLRFTVREGSLLSFFFFAVLQLLFKFRGSSFRGESLRFGWL